MYLMIKSSYDRGWINNEKLRNGYDIVENKGASWEDMVRIALKRACKSIPPRGEH